MKTVEQIVEEIEKILVAMNTSRKDSTTSSAMLNKLLWWIKEERSSDPECTCTSDMHYGTPFQGVNYYCPKHGR